MHAYAVTARRHGRAGRLRRDRRAADRAAAPRARASRRVAAAAPRARRSRAGARPSPPRNGGGRHWGRRIFMLIVLAVIAAGLYAANKTFQPFHGEGEGTVAVTIPEGSDAGEIGKILAAAGVVDSARFFELNATINGDRGKLRPGKYTLKQGMTNGDAIAALQVVPEGPKAGRDRRRAPARGPVAQGERAGRRQEQEGRGRLREGHRVEGHAARGSASSARRGARRPPRASCSRPPTRCRRARRPTGWSRSSSTRSRRTSPRST